MGSIGVDGGVHPDFGSGTWEGGPIGIPYDVVGRRTPRSRVRFGYADESDRVRYPIPRRRPHGGRPGRRRRPPRAARRPPPCRLYELFALRARSGRLDRRLGRDLEPALPRLRPAGWTSADAAGLPILPLLARYPEVRRGRIDHALRVTVRRSRRAYVYPARHFASDTATRRCRGWASACGSRRRSTSRGLPRQARVVARAMQAYGLIVADNGSDWFVSGAPHPRWDDDQLRALGRLRGRDFEVVRARARTR